MMIMQRKKFPRSPIKRKQTTLAFENLNPFNALNCDNLAPATSAASQTAGAMQDKEEKKKKGDKRRIDTENNEERNESESEPIDKEMRKKEKRAKIIENNERWFNEICNSHKEGSGEAERITNKAEGSEVCNNRKEGGDEEKMSRKNGLRSLKSTKISIQHQLETLVCEVKKKGERCGFIAQNKDEMIQHSMDFKVHDRKSIIPLNIDFSRATCEICKEEMISRSDKLAHFKLQHEIVLQGYCPSCNLVVLGTKYPSRRKRHGAICSRSSMDQWTIFYDKTFRVECEEALKEKENKKRKKDVFEETINQKGRGCINEVLSKNGAFITNERGVDRCVMCYEIVGKLTKSARENHFKKCIGKQKFDSIDEDIVRIEKSTQRNENFVIRYQHRSVIELYPRIHKILEPYIKKDLEDKIKEKKEIAVEFVAVILFERINEEEVEQSLFFARCMQVRFLESSIGVEINNYLSSCLSEILEKIEGYSSKGSGWKMIDVISTDLNITVTHQIRPGNYVPPSDDTNNIIKNRAITVRNKDNQCILYMLAMSEKEREEPGFLKMITREYGDILPLSVFEKYFGGIFARMKTDLQKSNIILPLQMNDINIQRVKKALKIDQRINVFASEPESNLFYAKSLDRSEYCQDIYKNIYNEACFDDRVKGRTYNEKCVKCPIIAEHRYKIEQANNIDLIFYMRDERAHMYLFYDF